MAKQATSGGKKESPFDSFVTTMSEKLKDLTTLKISTIVQNEPFDYSHDQNAIIEPSSGSTPVEGIVSQIELVDGDISTKMTKAFVENHADLRAFHENKESQGQEIVSKNLELVKSIAEMLRSWISGDSK